MKMEEKINWKKKWLRQWKLMIWKNYRLAIRNKSSTIFQFVTPFLFILSLFIFQKAIESSNIYGNFYQIIKNNPPVIIENIPLCIIGNGLDHCWTFIYAPNNSKHVENIIKYICSQNNPPIPLSSVLGFANGEDINEFLFNNVNVTQGAYIFQFSGLFNDTENNSNNNNNTSMNYIIQINQTDSYSLGITINNAEYLLIPMQIAVEKAMLQYGISVISNYTQNFINYSISLIHFPHEQILNENFIGQFGPIWIFSALLINLVIFLSQIVSEKENLLRDSMKIMGLYDSVYWTSWFITFSFFATCSVFSIIIMGCICQFDFFLKNSFGLYFFLLELFALSLISLTFLASTILNKSSNAIPVGFFTFFIGFFLQFGATIIYSGNSSSKVLRIVLALLSPTLLQIGFVNLGSATAKQSYQGLKWSDVNNTQVTEITTMSFLDMYIWLIIDFFLYLLLALYLDNILPNKYGIKKPFYYFLTKSYWTGERKINNADNQKKVTNDEELKNMDEDVKKEEEIILNENLPDNTAVIIKNLTKIYDYSYMKKSKWFSWLKLFSKKESFIAVKDLCLSIQKDTLFCLLGPNGAGKSTTIHILIGFLQATYGDAIIFGYSIRNNIKEIHSIMGVCPQFDILWNELSAYEHLYLFSGLKNINSIDIDNEIKSILNEVGLTQFANSSCSTYSGGMRRRLSVAIALIGNPKIVILDEPTTGMDPISRREVWNFIQKSKKKKVILLTTHSMEEADILGDKIAIMGKGRLQCIGNSLHLKQKFGDGYQIVVGTKEDKILDVINFFTNHFKKIKILPNSSSISGYLSFSIPREDIQNLIKFFEIFESYSKKLEIKDIQLSITTLEQVFLNISSKLEEGILEDEKEENFNEEEKENQFNKEEKENQNNKEENLKENISLKIEKEEKFSLKNQFKALFLKNITLQLTEKKTNICQIVTPFLFVILLFSFQVLINSIQGNIPIPEILNPSIQSPFHVLTHPKDLSNQMLYSNNSIILQSLNKNGAKLLYSFSNNISSNIIGNYTNGNGLLGKIIPKFGKPFNQKFHQFHQNIENEFNLYNDPNILIPFNFEYCINESDIQNKIFQSYYKLPSIIGGYYFEKIDFKNYNFHFYVYFNYSLTYGIDVPYLINHITNSISNSLPAGGLNITLLGIKQMPTKKSNGIQTDIIAEGGTLAYMLILNQLLPVFIVNIVDEKETKIRELMKMTGLKFSVYWVVHYIFDYMLYILVCCFLLIGGFLFKYRWFTTNSFATYFILFFIWGHVLIATSFLFSIFFNKKKTALVVSYIYVIAIGLTSYILIENIIGNFYQVSESIKFGISIIPPFALYRGLYYLTATIINGGPGFSISNLNNNIINLASIYIFLTIEWIILMILWLYLEIVFPSQWGVKKHPLFFLKPLFKKFKKSIDNNTDISLQEIEISEDILQEKNKLLNESNNFAITVKNLTKIYKNNNKSTIALKNVSFGLEKNTCLGILGHNGAGKTTLINTLIGMFPPSYGNAFIKDYSIIDQLSIVHTLLGICPQFDILWNNLTGEDHLLFYGRIRGMKGKILKNQIDSILKKLNLYYFKKIPISKYSGGMKRRLSVAIAILGNPYVIYLDEPSTGLDPRSRQKLWQVINESKKNSSILLTTHSMEEADTICDKIMIMLNGEIKCIGVSADLKNRFGSGYCLSIHTNKENELNIQNFIQKLEPKAILIHSLSSTFTYQIPKGKDCIPLHILFSEIEKNKEKFYIYDWAITNTTLEEVFLSINLSKEKL